jgi:VWFA-related protein
MLAVPAWGQQPQQDIPDAPSASRPPQTFPSTPPPESPSADVPPQPPPPDNGATPRSGQDQKAAPEQQKKPAAEDNTVAPPPPMPPVKTVPAGSVPPAPDTQTELYRITSNVNFVLVPVAVKDLDGNLVSGLQAKDFRVLEDGVEQKLSFFTSDPSAISAAVILDFGMPDAAVQKVVRTFPALAGAFSQFDEVSLYSYSSAVSKVSDFGAASQQLVAHLNELKTVRGRNNGPPVTSGPLASGPVVNGMPIDQPVAPVSTPPKESHVLNDAILKAATDLSARNRARRKVVFIISDGREYGSKAAYRDVLKVLLTNNIMVYAVGVEGSAMPAYGKLSRLGHLPKMGYSDILPKYVTATGGGVFNELSSNDIEIAYSAAMGDARNQYTLGYTTRLTPSSTYRQIDVRVKRLDVKVTAKDGYYPLPPQR